MEKFDFVVQGVVKANSKSNGNGQISTPPHVPKIPEWILVMQLLCCGYYDTCKCMRHCTNVGGLGKRDLPHVSVSFTFFITLFLSVNV